MCCRKMIYPISHVGTPQFYLATFLARSLGLKENFF